MSYPIYGVRLVTRRTRSVISVEATGLTWAQTDEVSKQLRTVYAARLDELVVETYTLSMAEQFDIHQAQIEAAASTPSMKVAA